jgi:8-oxo-dGTP pyrophosphatase MutT (NUDIX family)
MVMSRPFTGLTADMFVIRGGKFLVLERAAGLNLGFCYLPGGLVEPSEDPLAAAVRETWEESGLVVRDPLILRVWAYPTSGGYETVHATYASWSDDGDVHLSWEHSGSHWVGIDDYVAGWCSEAHGIRTPSSAVFYAQVRRNCELLRPLLEG